MQQQIQFLNHRDEKLAGTLHAPTEPSRFGIVFGHCFTCSRHTSILRWISTALVEEGFTVLGFDFSGNGQSEGSFSESFCSKQVVEMKIAAAFMWARGISWLGLGGHSMGALVAMLAASETDSVKAVCTLGARTSGPTVSDFLTDTQVDELRKTGRVPFTSRGRLLELKREFFGDAAQYDLPAVVGFLRQPLLVVHGEKDEIIPVDEAYKLRQAKPVDTELAIISGADHMFSLEAHRRQVADLVVQWFKGLASKDELQ
ncbi:MAG: alpha/beta fold hydrolase [Deltaproteobacteria bacterium]|nr:MAG: alpha/beta fold hydrolase [Deltaproteobacteria bacterium]